MSGDEFGYAIDIDSAGTTIVVSSPRADFAENDQGQFISLSMILILQ
jgi:hypothetical protein